MRQTCSDTVIGVHRPNLGLISEAPHRGRKKQTIVVLLENRPVAIRRLALAYDIA
jgi:hypothetical protein